MPHDPSEPARPSAPPEPATPEAAPAPQGAGAAQSTSADHLGEVLEEIRAVVAGDGAGELRRELDQPRQDLETLCEDVAAGEGSAQTALPGGVFIHAGVVALYFLARDLWSTDDETSEGTGCPELREPKAATWSGVPTQEALCWCITTTPAKK
ncbi:hypothetical protein AB0I49_21400 [Streptomyces sp. NPDC050617]|uniref:hypothetical protein n=1 Tax=Streptomyces sp. NPDC050617 TaxID=3154628 RepID=UPI00343BA612